MTFNSEKNLTKQQQDTARRLIQEYDDVFAINPKKPKQTMSIEHRIITGDALPVHQKPGRIPKAWEGEVDAQIKEMLENEIIHPSASPWNSPIILVKKERQFN